MMLVGRSLRHPCLRRIVHLLIIGVPLAFLFGSLVDNWQAVRSYDWQFDGARGGLAVFCLLAAFGLLPLASRQAFSGLGYSISYCTAYRGYFITQLAKYLPGGLWVIPSRAVVFRQIGVNMISSTVGAVIEMCMFLISGLLVSLPYLLFARAESTSEMWICGVLLAPITLIGLHPKVLNPVIRWLLVRMGYTDVDVNMTGGELASILLIDVVFWPVAGIGFFLLVSSVQATPLMLGLVLPSAFSLAWVAGFLAFLTPGGLGVREGALALLLMPFLPAPLPAVVALLARLWWTVAELVSVAIAAMIRNQVGKLDEQT